MAKTILGIDMGYDSLKLALLSGSTIKKAVSVPMPQRLIREGRIVSPETMGELIRTTMKENGIHAQKAALVLPNETVFIKTATMPLMNAEQLDYNLPFEFRDYITDELKNYVFDYAMISTPAEAEANGAMELLAVATPTAVIEEARAVLRKAGLKLAKAVPAICTYLPLIKNLQNAGGGDSGEYCILDLGYQSIRMYMYKGDRHEVTRELEVGMSALDNAVSDAYNVDVHLAHTYLLSNYDGCQEKEPCTTTYGNIAVELMRALNFYRFSNPDSQLSDVWLCGGGAANIPLSKTIESTLEMRIHPAYELMPGSNPPEISFSVAEAVGAALD